MPVLEVDEVTVRIGGLSVLDRVSVSVEPGSVTGLIGPNGAGKTTLFDVITGVRRPDSGHLALDGTRLERAAAHRRARAGIARTFQALQLFGTLTVRENVLLGARPLGRGARGAAADAVIERLGLAAVADRPSQLLPTGTGRLVELARSLVAEPTYLLLDEPASGQSESETAAFARIVREVAADGVGVLLVEHDVPLVMDLCSTVHVLDQGRLLTTGTPAEVRADPAVQAAYLGSAVPT
ncbi:MAG: ATP-binding cassette domain-containing protein [Actinobacteria bacterium]|nr:ATP-binding cassette domain-containing protein [Actinomycetota bacterium]